MVKLYNFHYGNHACIYISSMAMKNIMFRSQAVQYEYIEYTIPRY